MRSVLLLLCGVLLATPARADDLLAEAAHTEASTEALVHGVLAAALAGDRGATVDALAAVERLDEAREDAGLRRSGLRDDLRCLAAALEPSPTARREALEAVLDDDPDPEAERQARHRLEGEDGTRAARLLADDAHNRRANLVNDALRPFGVFTGAALLAAVNPILLAGSAVDSVATTAANLWSWNALSAPEREALVRYRAHLLREPQASDLPAAARALRRLGEKRARALCKGAIEAGDAAVDDGDLDRAAFWLRHAQTLEGCADEARKPLEQLARATAAVGAAEEAGRWPVTEPRGAADDGEAHAHAELARALAGGDADAILTAAQGLLGGHPDSDLAPGARLAVAVARERAGHPEDARRALEDAADDDGSPGRLAAAMLDDPRYAPLDGLAAAERAHTADVVRYVVLGGASGRTAIYGAAQLGAQGAQAAQSLGIFNVIGMATRGWRAWRNDPASNETIIERGEALLAREPDAAEAPQVHERLATAYARAGNYERAIMHVRAMPAPDGDRLAALEAKLAAKLVEDVQGSPAERLLLAAIARHFPATDAAGEAEERLAALPAGGEIRLDRAMLAAHPGLLGPGALDLEPPLLDGDRHNGELAERGLALLPGALRLALVDTGESGEREETRPLSAEQAARALAAVEDAFYARLLTREDREPETGRYERWIPVFLSGSVGEDGVSVTPGIKLRRYRSEDPTLYR